jgi:hypothetical protein
MVELTPTPEAITAALEIPADLNFDLPDPDDEEIQEHDFQQQLDNFWQLCERFDLQTEIWRGRILRSIRDREKKGGDGRGTGFMNWLKQREISKTQAYALIQLANSADSLIADGQLDPSSINNFSKRAFVDTAKSAPEVQKLISDAAHSGDRITRREVKQLADEWTAMSSDLLPDVLKEKATDGSLPTRHLAPLVKELEKMPDVHLEALQKEAIATPDVDTVKYLTTSARNLSKYLDSAAKVQTLKAFPIDIELALEEALRLDCLNTAADLLKQATQLEQCVAKLFTTWKRLGTLSDRLYVDTGASTPNLRSLLTAIESLTQEVIEVPLDEGGENTVRLRIITDVGQSPQ